MAVRAIGWGCWLGLMTGAVLATGADAAVRICESQILVTGNGATEKEARKQALDLWKAAAAKLGEGYTGWRLAADKVLACKKAEGGGFSCVARGAPCTIDQAPDKRELRSKRLDT